MQAEPSRSLIHALRSIAREHHADIDEDDLAAAMADSWLICAVPDEPDVGRWMMYARDAFLVDAARVFGLTVRALHPPRAAVGLERSAEFTQHFKASYRPLILRALEHRQPVLAWRGWAEPFDLHWGIVRRIHSDGQGFAGEFAAQPPHGCTPVVAVLERPATQVYVVERIAPRPPVSTELIDAAVRHAEIAVRGKLAGPFHVLSGRAAMDALIARLCTLKSDEAQSDPLAPFEAYTRCVQVGCTSFLLFTTRRLNLASQATAKDLIALETAARQMEVQCQSAVTTASPNVKRQERIDILVNTARKVRQIMVDFQASLS